MKPQHNTEYRAKPDLYQFGDVEMLSWEYDIIAAVVMRGTCPFCGRIGLKNNFGSKAKHMNYCGKLLTRLGQEKKFAEWITEARTSGRWLGNNGKAGSLR